MSAPKPWLSVNQKIADLQVKIQEIVNKFPVGNEPSQVTEEECLRLCADRKLLRELEALQASGYGHMGWYPTEPVIHMK